MQLATNILLALIFIVLSSVVVLSILAAFKIRAIFTQFVTPQSEKEPSPFALWVDSVATMFGRSVTAQVKAMLMGSQSGDVRAAKAVQGAMALDQAEGMGLGSALESMPNLRRSLRKNPGLMDLAIQFLPQLLSRNGGSSIPNSSNGNHSSEPAKFRL